MSLHVYANIHMSFLAYQTLGFGISCCRSVKILSSLVGVVRGRMGGCVICPRYFVCSLRVALRRRPGIK